MGVPIFKHFGASHVPPHDTLSPALLLDIHQSQLAHEYDYKPVWSKILFSKTMIFVILALEGWCNCPIDQAKDSFEHCWGSSEGCSPMCGLYTMF